ncbi:MAG TPA: phosphoribosylformylglycinamidine synthase I [Phycisphaerae bacterium]|nr:phosphoribosylformylglycinamidine synthase I [Phycisphaerae bacterium]HNU44534.1 phosphoribosylformylglycinamidine synthase I [Phycisphaerae bacterium]
MARVRVLVVRAPGINCDEETVYAWQVAGAEADLVHVNRLVEQPQRLDDYQIVTFPGGFSYGDDIAAGVILAQHVTLHLAERMRELVARGGGLLGICNGFQVLVKAGLLPDGAAPTSGSVPETSRTAVDAVETGAFEAPYVGHGGPTLPLQRSLGTGGGRQVTVTFNDSARFEARWVRLEVTTEHCVFLRGGELLELPVEHAEGKVVTADDSVISALRQGGHVALRYVDHDGRSDRYPANPNGSVAGIAGLCDSTGRVLGLMPHPERHLDATHHPLWTRRAPGEPPDGLKIFRRAVEHWSA